MRDIPNRRVAKIIDSRREDRRFVLRSQRWIRRHFVVVIECLRCGGMVGLKGKVLMGDKFACPDCGRRSNLDVVRRQIRPGDTDGDSDVSGQ